MLRPNVTTRRLPAWPLVAAREQVRVVGRVSNQDRHRDRGDPRHSRACFGNQPSAHNAGDDALVLLLVSLHTEGEPLLTLMATPTP
jgi:hypothetical protein